MRKYVNIWMTDCPFEVSTTNRYTIVKYEASITARQDIKKDEKIKYLCGTLVAMTPEEEADLDFGRSDFSIVTSTRKKTPSLFLGPARFANHDCNANARLVSLGSGGMEVIAVRKIFQGEEITVSYGESYFGEDNCDCLCASCEDAGRGGWPAQGQTNIASGAATPVDIETSGHYSLRSSRMHVSRSIVESASATPDISDLSPRKKRKGNDGLAMAPIQTATLDERMSMPHKRATRIRSGLRNEVSSDNDMEGSPDLSQHQARTIGLAEHVQAKDEDPLVASVRAAFAMAKDHSKRKRTYDEPSMAESLGTARAQMTPSNTVDQFVGVHTLPIIDVPETPRTPSNPFLVPPHADIGAQCSVTPSERTSPSSAPPLSTPASSISTSMNCKPLKLRFPVIDDDDSVLSDLPPSAELDEMSQTIVHRTPTPKQEASPLIQPLKSASIIIPTIEAPAITHASAKARSSSTRAPGDYIRTPLLLGEKYSRWVECRTCGNAWVQANSYLTRKECPRCERHSMLYGYQWPKTEKVDEDDEERVMDHRTVHRFITSEEEKSIRKRGRGLTKDNGESLAGGEDFDNGREDEEDNGPPKKRHRKATTKAKTAWIDGAQDDEHSEESGKKKVNKRKLKSKATGADEVGTEVSKKPEKKVTKKVKVKPTWFYVDADGNQISAPADMSTTGKSIAKNGLSISKGKVFQDKTAKRPRGRPRKV